MRCYLYYILVLLNFSILSANTIMTWVPPYGITKSHDNLMNANQGTWIQDGVTHIGLQFWVPGENGEVEQIGEYNYGWHGDFDQHASKVVAWGNKHNVDIMLCFFNVHTNDFDWEVARKAYLNNPDKTIENLLSKVDDLGLAGVDIDFEAGEPYKNEKEEFYSFIEKLGDALRARGKILSIDIAGTPCYGFPSPADAGDLAPYVDFINYMGYTSYYENNTESFGWCPMDQSQKNKQVFSFSYIYDYAVNNQGIDPEKINIGIPSWSDNKDPGTYWGDQYLEDHIKDIQEVNLDMGLAIWDIQLNGGGKWYEEDTWETLKDFKNKNEIINSVFNEQVVPKPYHVFSNKIEAKENLTIRIYSINGKLVSLIDLKQGKSFKYTAKLDTDFYIMQFYTAQGEMYTEKMVVVN